MSKSPPRFRPALTPLEGRIAPTVTPIRLEHQATSSGSDTTNPTSLVTTSPDVGVAADGSYAVVFQYNFSSSDPDVYVRRFNRDGTPKSSNATIVVASSNDPETGGRIAMRSDGSFVVVWQRPFSSTSTSLAIFAQRYSSSGTVIGSRIEVSTQDMGTKDQYEPDVAVRDSNGDFAIVWTLAFNTSGDLDTLARAFSSSGTPITETVSISTSASESTKRPRIDAHPGTGTGFTYAISFLKGSLASGTTGTAVVELFSSSLSSNSFELAASASSSCTNADVGVDSNRNFVVAFAAGGSIFYRRFNSSGTPATSSAETGISGGSYIRAGVAVADNGEFVISHLDTAPNPDRMVFRQYLPDGTPTGQHRFVTAHSAAQSEPSVAASGNGTFAFALTDTFSGKSEPWVRLFEEIHSDFLAVAGPAGRVVLRDFAGDERANFLPYGSGYTGAVSAAWGDVNGDGFPDLVTGALTGNPHVLIFDGKKIAQLGFDNNNPNASLLASFFPYSLGFNVGSYVAAGDFDGDGFAEVVTGAAPGNPHVEVYDGKTLPGTFTSDNPFGSLRSSFFPYATGFNVGATVAVGDVNGDGTPELVTGASRGNPQVIVFNGVSVANKTITDANKFSNLLGSFFAYGLGFNVGANVAVGDVDGNGFAEVITGATTGNPQIKVLDGGAFQSGAFNGNNPDASLLASFFAYEQGTGLGAAVAAVDLNNNRKFEILTGSTGSPRWRVVSGTSSGTLPTALLENTEPTLLGGIHVGA